MHVLAAGSIDKEDRHGKRQLGTFKHGSAKNERDWHQDRLTTTWTDATDP